MSRFWSWYERYYTVNLGLAAGLFGLQLIHLYWLTTDVVFSRLFEVSLFNPSPVFELGIILVDYTEIPAILTTSLVYINQIRIATDSQRISTDKKSVKISSKSVAIMFLILINSQWLHIFWITDEFIVSRFIGQASGTVLPVWLAFLAIGIDYLELPVIYNTGKRFLQRL